MENRIPESDADDARDYNTNDDYENDNRVAACIWKSSSFHLIRVEPIFQPLITNVFNAGGRTRVIVRCSLLLQVSHIRCFVVPTTLLLDASKLHSNVCGVMDTLTGYQQLQQWRHVKGDMFASIIVHHMHLGKIKIFLILRKNTNKMTKWYQGVYYT